MEVEAGREVDGQRHALRETCHRRGRHDLPEDRLDLEVDTRGPRELRRPDSGRAHDRRRLDRALVGRDPGHGPFLDVDGSRGAARHDRRPVGAGAGRVALGDRLRARVAVDRAEGRREDSVEPRERRERRGLGRVDHPARHPELVLQRDALLEHRDVLLAVEQEEISDLVEVDLAAGTLGEAREGLDAAKPDRDVQRIRELRPDSSRRAARRAGRERVALEEAHVDPFLREVERDAGADGAASDDHHFGTGWEWRHRRRRLRRKKRRLAGRSASRRIRYGYQSGPNGVATSTLYPCAARLRCRAGRTP